MAELGVVTYSNSQRFRLSEVAEFLGMSLREVTMLARNGRLRCSVQPCKNSWNGSPGGYSYVTAKALREYEASRGRS